MTINQYTILYYNRLDHTSYTELYYTIYYIGILLHQGDEIPEKLNFVFEGLAVFLFRHEDGFVRREAHKKKLY